jgi:DNA-binding PadR family transcriptional regulator
LITELLTLFILLKQSCTIYEIKKNINRYFSLFYSPSMGTIHPTLKKLHSRGYVSVKESMSLRGRKSCLYSITKSGKNYFEELFAEDLPSNPVVSMQLVQIKSLLLKYLDASKRISVISSLKNYYQNRLLDLKNYEHDFKEKENLNLAYIKFQIENISEELNWLKFQEL